jgi:hypothetical protein
MKSGTIKKMLEKIVHPNTNKIKRGVLLFDGIFVKYFFN